VHIVAKVLRAKGLQSNSFSRSDLARQLPFRGLDCKTLLCEKVILVQKIGWILAILFAVSWYASEISLPRDAKNAPLREEIVWRRTVDGWEKPNDWYYAIEKSPPALHPGVMGLLMVTLSLTVGISKNKQEEK
jgi:hypothetical protein